MIMIQCIDSKDALLTMIKDAVAEVLTASACETVQGQIKQEWITTPVLKLMLKEKGYLATSSLTIKKITSGFHVRTEKRGRDLWYNYSDVIGIPSKK